MKTRKSLKRLSLKRQTISRLNGPQMQGVHGGVTVSVLPTLGCTNTCPRLSVEIPCEITTDPITTNKSIQTYCPTICF
jgi:hypothetical protein